jgi:hypothetical protein
VQQRINTPRPGGDVAPRADREYLSTFTEKWKRENSELCGTFLQNRVVAVPRRVVFATGAVAPDGGGV